MKRGNNNKKDKLAKWTNLSTINGRPSTLIRRCSNIVGVNTNASGFYGATFLSSAVTTSTEWSSLSARWSEARVLQIKVHYADTVYPPNVNAIVFSTDRAGVSGAPTSTVNCWSGDNAKVFNTDVQSVGLPKYSARAIDLEDQDFSAVGAMTATFAIRAASQGPTAVVATIGFMFVEYLVEFRGAL
jgi:hypothetical protein